MDSAQTAIAEKLNSMSPEEARQAINNGKIYVGDPGSPNHQFALSLVAAKETALAEGRESRSLAISEEALRISKRATNIALIAMILSIATAIGIAIFQWVTKN